MLPPEPELPNVSTAFVKQFALIPAGDPEWLAPLRWAAMSAFERHGFPTTRNEEWHYTSPAPIAEASFAPMRPASGTVTLDQLAPYLAGRPDWPRLVFVNGRYAPTLSRQLLMP